MAAGTGGIHAGLIKYRGKKLNKLCCPEEEECGPEKGLLWRRGRRNFTRVDMFCFYEFWTVNQ